MPTEQSAAAGGGVASPEFADLRKFYGVETDAELIRIQAQHVERWWDCEAEEKL